MKQFFNNILSSDSDKSSKRFAGLVTLAAIITIAIVPLFKGCEYPEFMFWGLITFAGSLFGLTSVEQIFKSKNTPTNDSDKQQ